MKGRKAELDDFWNIEMLVPSRQNRSQKAANTQANGRKIYTSVDTETVEITYDRKNGGEEIKTDTLPAERIYRDGNISNITAESGKVQMPETEYRPENSLIRRVAVYKWKNSYNYYEQFCRDGKRLLALEGRECEKVPFFSYVPQYSQMNEVQLQYYLYWRSCAAHGKFISADYSYILLNIFELINLSDSIDPVTARSRLIGLWRAYRDEYPRLDRLLCDWICDFSLIHRLPPPDEREIPLSLFSSVISACTLKEYYVSGADGDIYARTLIMLCSNYDYKKSKFYAANAALYDRCIYGAVKAVVSEFSRDGRVLGSELQSSRLLRDAYCGALCSYRIKRKLEIEYCSFTRSYELRFIITDVIKYTENRIRGHISVKSRLGIHSLTDDIKKCIDCYLAAIIPPTKKRTQTHESESEYEKLYDLPKHEFSLEKALKIENESWETTQKLIETFGECVESELTEVIEKTEIDAQGTEPTESSEDPIKAFIESIGRSAEFLRLVYDRDLSEQKRYPDRDMTADTINERAVDILGDIVIEESDDGNGYVFIEDYIDMFKDFYESQV